jgi:hypothetical protein
MSDLIWSAKSLDISIENGAIVLEQNDGSEYKFARSRITITALQVPQVVTALRKAVAKFASANVQTREASRRGIRKYKYTRRAAGLGESKKASSPAADGKESSEVGHDRKLKS